MSVQSTIGFVLVCSCLASAQSATASDVRQQTPSPAPNSALVITVARPPSSTLPAATQQGTALLVGGSDDCATAEVITGTGSFAFDNTSATTSAEGQLNFACSFYSSTAIANDVWFAWTAPATGRVTVTDCGQSFLDSKLAVYDVAALGGSCPPVFSTSLALACNDDVGYGHVEARVSFDVTLNSVYLIQLGTHPGVPPAAGGAGTFTIEYVQPDPTPCQDDDGSAEVSARLVDTPLTEQLVLQRFGAIGETAFLDSIRVSYGALFTALGSALTDGYPVKVLLYDDPNDDGDATDAVLVDSITTTVQQHDTDQFNGVPLSPPVFVTGVYFLGWSFVNPAVVPPAFRPFGADYDSCEANLDAWSAWNSGGAMNFADLSASGGNSHPVAPYVPSVLGIPTSNLVWMVRPGCAVPDAGVAFCFGDGTFTDHTTPCPCGNNGAPGNGCAHSFSSAGANLAASGATLADNVVLHSSGTPASSFTLFMQHTMGPGTGSGGATFHDGVICAGGTLVRLRGRAAVAGEAFFPNSNFAQDSTTTLSQRGMVTVGSGTLRRYAAWYRNASTTFCPPATANVTNGWKIVW